MKGYSIGIFEIIFYFIGSFIVRKSFTNLKTINAATYYWVMMTILTGLWEISYLSNYNEVTIMAHNLITTNEHVWTNSYDFSYVWPPKLAKIFYAEYGAWADREYMSDSDDWSRIIEGTHCTQCALFSFIAIFFNIIGNHNNYLIALSVSMGTQFMNSLLYMAEYSLQTYDKHSVNYNSDKFPTGKYLLERPFMYINYLWLLFPAYAIFTYVTF